jgi:hypothetical protein
VGVRYVRDRTTEMTLTPIVLLASAFAFVSLPVFAGDAADPTTLSPAEKAWRSTDSTKNPKQRGLGETKAAISPAPKASGGEASGQRWDEMTPQEQDAARKRWLLNSGDFGPPGRARRSTPSSVPTTKERRSAVEAAERAQASERSVPAK